MPWLIFDAPPSFAIMMDSRQYRHLESLFSSVAPSDIQQFYLSIESIAQLIQFSTSRPSAEVSCEVLHQSKPPTAVAVIPTADASSKRLTRLLDYFSDIPVICVRSSGPLFNFARSMNYGIALAQTLGPEVVILANDDVVPEGALRAFLEDSLRSSVEICVPTLVDLHGRRAAPNIAILEQSTFAESLLSMVGSLRKVWPSETLRARIFAQSLPYYSASPVMRYLQLDARAVGLGSDPGPRDHPIARMVRLSNRLLWTVPKIQPFVAIRATVFEKERFDETFINGGEETDLSLRLHLNRARVAYSDSRIRAESGTSLGTGSTRTYRSSVFECLYFGYKLMSYKDASFDGDGQAADPPTPRQSRIIRP